MNGAAVILCIAAAAAAGTLGTFLFNAVPARWLCDYGEQPGDQLQKKRICLIPHGAVMAVISAVCFLLFLPQYQNGVSVRFYAACAAVMPLLLIAVSDFLYRIIPDEFVLFLLLTALAFHWQNFTAEGFRASNLLFPVLGAAAGAALMLLMGLLGQVLYRKEAMGFGDTKLFAAAGLFAGFPLVIPLFFTTIFLAFFHIIFLYFRRKMPENRYLPFGPYICLALLLFLAFQSQIAGLTAWYLALLNW